MSDITDRLKELAHAAADQNWGEFSMRVPADHARDADLVLLAASKEITSLRAELERERMRLAACGVVAMANTPESAARARDIHPDYRSASCDDVARAVDSEMSLRAELAEAKRDKHAALEALSDMVFQFFMEDGDLLHHSFMSAEEHAIGVLIAQGRAEEVGRNRYRLIDAAMAGGAE